MYFIIVRSIRIAIELEGQNKLSYLLAKYSKKEIRF
jgi:hypothetical protein